MTDAYRQHGTILVGDCLEHLRTLPDCSVDSVVTDPPYGLSDHAPKEVIACLTAWLAGEPYKPKGRGFMGKSWDAWVPGPEVWRECLRVLKPGGHLVAFAGTRSMDLMAMAVRLAGFELRDAIGLAEDSGNAPLLAWSYGSGFPKSLDVSKAIDKVAGVEREKSPTVPMQKKGEVGEISKNVRCATCGKARASGNPCVCPRLEDMPVTDAARQWQGWGTALKPAWEPIILARKPFDGTVAANVLAYGTGALNIDACRVPVDPDADASQLRTMQRGTRDGADGWGMSTVAGDTPQVVRPEGRWPANVIHDGSEEVLAAFPDAPGQQGDLTGNEPSAPFKNAYGEMGRAPAAQARGDIGSAARFFYCAKASRADRNDGCDGLPLKPSGMVSNTSGQHLTRRDGGAPAPAANNHPTVKPTDLMRWLCRLVTPPGGVVLDPFMGSGSTGRGAVLEGFEFIGIELSEEYAAIARARIATAERTRAEDVERQRAEAAQGDMFGAAA